MVIKGVWISVLTASTVAMPTCARVGPPAADRAPVAAAAVFERNEGQAPAGYAYLARHAEHEFAFARDVVRIAINPAEGALDVSWPPLAGSSDAGAQLVDLRFEGGRASKPIGERPLEGRINYLRGDATSWITGVPTYERVRYADVYDGIDVVFYATGSRVEYDVIVQPHADPSAIGIRFDGATRVRIDNGGDLVVEAGDRSFVQRKPAAYQERGGSRTAVRAAYRMAGERVGLMLGTYDPVEPLVIDPEIAR
jgi:hypothetical protein